MENKFTRKPEYTVPANMKKATIAKFLENQIREGKDISEHMGKPLNHWDYEAIYNYNQEHNEKQQKLELEKTSEPTGATTNGEAKKVGK